MHVTKWRNQYEKTQQYVILEKAKLQRQLKYQKVLGGRWMNRWNTGFGGRKTILYDTYVTTHLSKSTEWTTPRVKANVNCSLYCWTSFTQQIILRVTHPVVYMHSLFLFICWAAFPFMNVLQTITYYNNKSSKVNNLF